jgi:RNA polymerase subunit RPABC4/transcription elongation factor Spt4
MIPGKFILQAEEADNFFDSGLWWFLTRMAWAVLVALWLALIYWVYKDARRRIADPLMVWAAVAAAVFPFVGPLIYAILRPPEYLDDVMERDLEIKAREMEIRQREKAMGGAVNVCPACHEKVRDDYLNCPRCKRELKTACSTCKRPIEPDWRICPFCSTETGATMSAQGDMFAE